MSYTIFLSPSRQKDVIGNGEYGNESKRMNELANIVEAELERNGVFVEREGNEVEVSKRIKSANALKVDAYIALHSNYAPDNLAGKLIGTEIYVRSDDENSTLLASDIIENLREVPGFIEKGIRCNNKFAEIMLPQMPCCLVEVDYHDSYERSYWILENMNRIALAIVKGILNYFNIPYEERTERKYYRVQLGAFSNKLAAEKLSRKLIEDGYPTVVKFY